MISNRSSWSHEMHIMTPHFINNTGEVNDKCVKEIKPTKNDFLNLKKYSIQRIYAEAQNLNYLEIPYCLFAILYIDHFCALLYTPAFVHYND